VEQMGFKSGSICQVFAHVKLWCLC